MEALRQWLNHELTRRGWSQSELARQAGLSQSLVSKTIAGERSASADFCVKVAVALNSSPESVLRLAGILPPAPPASPTDDSTLQELVELARTLSPDDRQQILDYVRFIMQKAR